MRALYRTGLLGLLVAVIGCVAVGCASHPHDTALADWRPTARKAAAKIELPPRYGHLAIGKVDIKNAPPGSPEEERLPVDTNALRLALRDLLRESGGFTSVDLNEDLARQKVRAGLILEGKVEGATIRRDADQDSAVASFFAYFFGGWMADWYHNQTYAMELTPVFEIRDPLTPGHARLIATRPRRTRTVEALSFVERRPDTGPFVATVFWIPPFTFDSSPEQVTGWLAPLCLRKPVEELLGRLARLRRSYRVRVRMTPEVALAKHGIKVELRSKPELRVAERHTDLLLYIDEEEAEVAIKRVRVAGFRKQPPKGEETYIVAFRGYPLRGGKRAAITLDLVDGTSVPIGSIEVTEELVSQKRARPRR